MELFTNSTPSLNYGISLDVGLIEYWPLAGVKVDCVLLHWVAGKQVSN